MCDTVFSGIRKPENTVFLSIPSAHSRDDNVKFLVVAKQNNACKNASVESVWNVVDAEYKLTRQSGKDFIVGRIPSKLGDTTAAGKYFTKTDLFLVSANSGKPTDELLSIYHSVLTDGIEMGYAAIVTVLDKLGIPYEIFDADKL